MKKIIFLIISLALISCKNEKINDSIEAEAVPFVKSVSKTINKRDFPIKNFSKIELVSYYNRIIWDTVKYKGERSSYKMLVDNYKLTFDSTMIQERVILNKTQEKELLNLMICDTCVPEEMPSACYDPRHMILFRDDKNRIIGYNEFCINCIGSRNSPNLEGFQKYCYSEMGELFKKFGIKLFVESGNEEKKEDEFLRNLELNNRK